MKKREIIRVAITEVIMTLAVIFLTFAFVMVVSGYWINSDLEVKQNGFIQVYSSPRGATIKVDDDTWFNRTNASQMVSSGEREITLSRDGYDTWTKKITVSEGVLYRLAYPRLFKQNRETVKMLNVEGKKVSISYNKNKLLLMDSGAIFEFIDLTRDTFLPKKVDVSGANLNGNLVSNIVWSENGEKILISTKDGQWVLVSTEKNDYLNLTKEFGLNFSIIKSLDDAYNDLVVVENGNLRKINTNSKSISNVLATNVKQIWSYDEGMFYLASDTSNNESIYYMIDEKESVKIRDGASASQLTYARFYDEKYLAILDGEKLEVYRGEMPRSATEELNMELVFEDEIAFGGNLSVGLSGNFILIKNGLTISALNMEEMKISKYDLESDSYGWLDNYLVYVVQDGKMIVRDFDGENRREIVLSDVNASYPATITRDRYLYYFVENTLVREEIQ